ncbi:hypothetical protein UK23_23820 [Lentzea aerocolonigenes]|uniref:HTH araC/xylS-type domain-containing protein n=1 Tax=Lentzea aerocolonigenes TaxID=68170 RepID=A0A0F0GWF8_LENAE|nr:hypothetical protein [Lentzea aerocolonigenes]KJK46347.1 hypothetical protein UK23_23820 [Lentzea aerocolonigenes]
MTPELHADAENARRCLRGDLLADELTTRARELAVTWLHRRSLPDAEIATRLGLTTYTAARIRARLRLPVNPLQEVVSRGA